MNNKNVRLSSIFGAVEYWSKHSPEKQAFILLKEGNSIEQTLSYAGLYRSTLSIAAAISNNLKNIQTPVLMLFPTGLEFIKAFLAIQASRNIAIPVFPPRNSKHLNRLQNVIHNSEAKTILTTSCQKEKIESWLSKMGIEDVALIITDEIGDEQILNSEASNFDLRDISFIQYTSGSTGQPKGVVITNENLMANEALIKKMSQLANDDILLSWLPFYHDMGLIGNILFSIYNGSTCYLMTPYDFIRNPTVWLKAISRFKVTASGGPNFAFDLCTERISIANLAGVDLSTWKMAFNGAEPIREDTLINFSEKFATVGFNKDAFFPCYGLAEATLFVSGGGRKGFKVMPIVDLVPNADNRAFETKAIERVVSSGKIWAEDVDVKILRSDSDKICTNGEIGEICIAGKSITGGYWKKEQHTDFFANINGKPYLKTGDLGTIHKGELFITGRLKELIILNGQNYYPYDIEKLVAQVHEAIKNNGVAAFSVDQGKKEQLVIMLELERVFYRKVDPKLLFSLIQKELSSYLNIRVYDVVILKPFAIPRTTSGKIMRLRCRENYSKGNYDLEWSKLGEAKTSEEKLVETKSTDTFNFLKACLEEITGEKIEVLTQTDKIIDFALDSIDIAVFMGRIFDKFNEKIDIKTIFEGCTIGDIEKKITRNDIVDKIETFLPSEELKEALSKNQKSLWYLDNTNFALENNVGLMFTVKGGFELSKWKKDLLKIINRHEALRTGFHFENGGLRRMVSDALTDMPVVTTHEEHLEQAQLRLLELFNERFDLKQAPLFRLILVRTKNEQLVAFCCHHMICDGWSLNIIFNEFCALLTGRSLPSVGLPFSSLIAFENKLLSSSALFNEALTHYKQTLRINFNQPIFLKHYSEEKHHSRVTQYIPFTLDKEKVYRISKENKSSVYLSLLSIFHIALSNFTNNVQILSASPVSRREEPSWARSVGYFTNLQYLKSDLSLKQNFNEVLQQLKTQFAKCHQWQGIPYAAIVEEVFSADELREKALLNQFLFSYQSLGVLGYFRELFSNEGLEMAGLNLKALNLPQQVNAFSLAMEVFDNGQELTGFLKFQNQNEAERSIFENLLSNFEYLVDLFSVEGNRIQKLSTLELFESRQKENILNLSVGEKWLVPDRSPTVIAAFEAQAKKSPENLAIQFEYKETTYGALNEMANQLAWYITSECTVRSDQLIGLKLPRNEWMIAGMLAVMKTGAAYVPIDLDYPEERQRFMEEDAGAAFLLDERKLEAFKKNREQYSKQNLNRKISGNDLAYVLYTSGTTGRPKGVMIEHKAMADYVSTAARYFSLNEKDRMIQQSSISFDVIVEEVFPTLTVGASLILMKHGGKDIDDLVKKIKQCGATIISSTPLVINELNKFPLVCNTLRTIISGGDVLERRHIDSLINESVEIYNTYGSTEATVCATYSKIMELEDVHTIGKVIPNKTVFILDKNNNLSPLLVEGEICIGGNGLARGYLNKPDLTAEKFIAHPFLSGEKLYRTGDIGRWLPDGKIDFLGRVDEQVKIRGYRIELSEIELTLSKHPSINTAIVIAKKIRNSTVLIAFYVQQVEVASGDLRQFLQEKLPSYMVPKYFVAIDELPLSANGKLDRNLLSLPEDLGNFPEHDHVSPTTEIEKKLVVIWGDILNIPEDKISINANFFELGGESILLMKVKNAIESEFGLTIDVGSLLRSFSIQAIADYVESVQWISVAKPEKSNSETEFFKL